MDSYGGNAYGVWTWDLPAVYQMVMHESQLVDMVGKQITGISLRLNEGSLCSYSFSYSTYNLTLAPAKNPLDSWSVIFAENYLDGTFSQVRSGPLTLSRTWIAGEFFDPPLEFDRPYVYTGGHLLIELRHSGAGVGVYCFWDFECSYPSFEFRGMETIGNMNAAEGLASIGCISIIRFEFTDVCK